MTEHARRRGQVRAALDTERSLVLSLGGYAFEVSGGTLLLHERIPVPRFNFVQVEGLSPQRQAGFFERTLDQYFQRAIRPTFRVPMPTAPHIDRTLQSLGFRPRVEPLVLLGRSRPTSRAKKGTWSIRHGPQVATESIVPFWVAPRDAPVLASALEILRHHPNPGETLLPVLAMEDTAPVGAGMVYARGEAAFIFGVSTVPSARNRGVASALVEWILSHPPATRERIIAVFSESRRLERRLRSLGFEPWARWRVYELNADAELTLAPLPPSGGPLWRPPRQASGDASRSDANLADTTLEHRSPSAKGSG